MYVRAEIGVGDSVIYYDQDGNKTIRRGGTRAWRNNNPGNIRKSSFAYSQGAIGHAGGFAVFPNYEKGRLALKTLFRGKTYSKLAIFSAIARYAPQVENDTENYRKLIEKITNLDLKHKIENLNSEEMEKLLNSIELIEGFSTGTEEYIEVKKIIDTQKKETGKIEQYQLEDGHWISKAEAIAMTEDENIKNAIVVHSVGRGVYLRSKPDKGMSNNFSEMAKH